MSPSPEEVVAALGPRPGVVWLDGGLGATGWSVVGWDPEEVVTEAAGWPGAGRGLGRRTAAAPMDVPFVSGVLGYLGYEAGAEVEPIPRRAPAEEPPVWLGRYRGALCFRHADRSWHPTGAPEVQAEGRELLARAAELPEVAPPPPEARAESVAPEAYEASVRQILAWVRAGDCYQVNLTRPVFVRHAGPPFAAYRRLRRASAAFGGYLQLSAETAVLSNSPELFLTVDGDRVVSRPIKGTRPRGAEPAEDAALAEELRSSRKDAAELTMIVDLVRNDLSKVARVGSVRAAPRAWTAHPTVHHASQDVQARLASGVDAWDALAATFPPGSVTGAPKIRACERIHQLEAHPRGVYCGAMGFVSDHGRAAFNVAIRTAVVHRDHARYHVGGGIVAASEPRQEWIETEVKARALAAAFLGAPSPK